MIKGTRYLKSNGAIIGMMTVRTADQFTSAETTLAAFIEGEYSYDTTYIPAGVATDRPTLSVTVDKTTVDADGIDFCTLSAVPLDAEIYINGVRLGISDGTDVEINFDLVGEYLLKVSLFPYLDFEETINAT